MAPVGSDWSPDGAVGSRADARLAALAPGEPRLRPARGPSSQAFEVRCADVHPGGCNKLLRAERSSDVVALVREHGALVHGSLPPGMPKSGLPPSRRR
jgi:hypothetical protein